VRWVRLLLWLAGILWGIAAEWPSIRAGDLAHWVPDLVTGWTLIGCGLTAWSRRPESRIGVLLAATGFSWFFGNLAPLGIAPLHWFGAYGLLLYRAPLVHLLVTYPSGRISTRLERAAVVAGYGAAILMPVWRSELATIVLSFLLIAVCAHSYLLAVGPARRARLLALGAAAGLGLVLAGGAMARLAIPAGVANHPSLLALEATLCVIAVGLLAGLLSSSWERAEVTDLVVELGENPSGTLRDELSRALGDPTLEVGYWLPDRAGFVDFEGRPRMLPDPDSDRAVTLVEVDRRPVAALIHDPAIFDDPGLRAAVSSAAQLAAANVRLQAEVRAQVDELRASRRRILEARDEERKRLERRLREGVEQGLAGLAEQIGSLRVAAHSEATTDRIDQIEVQLARTLDELRQLAHGLHPRVLAEAGLTETLASLALQAPIPISVDAPAARLPAQIEAASYFLCSEALANVEKYAAASRVSITITSDDGRARVEIADDGLGGADPSRGTGLRGLADRIEALGGTFRVESSPGMGTRLTAEFPLDGEAV
jgi:signal transduction histidine kinase